MSDNGLMDLETQLRQAIHDGIREGVKSRLAGYNSPLEKLLADIFLAESASFRSLLHGAITSAMNDETFRQDMAGQIRKKLAALLVQKFGGELERHVNALKSDPVTRARITLAIEEIVKERSSTV